MDIVTFEIFILPYGFERISPIIDIFRKGNIKIHFFNDGSVGQQILFMKFGASDHLYHFDTVIHFQKSDKKVLKELTNKMKNYE